MSMHPDTAVRLSPAVITGVFESGRITEWEAVGDPRRDGSETKRDTVFRIASMSKSFLAAAALALGDEGVLDIDRAIGDYVPGVRFVLGETEYQPTVRELLANRSGMPEDNAWGDRQLGATRDEIVNLGRAGFRLTARPGEKYQYSNVGMSLVGRAIEAVAGRRVEEEVRRRFIDPLGLAHTRYSAGEYPAGTDLAHGFRTFDGGETFVLEPFVGAGALGCIGSIFSTIDDIARWAWFLGSAFADDAANVDPVFAAQLSVRSRREMQRIHTPIPIGQPAPGRDLVAAGYGLGLFAEHDRLFGPHVSHSGGLPGFSSHMRWHVASGRGIVVFGNSDAFSAEQLAVSTFSTRLEASFPMPWSETLGFADRIDAALSAGASLGSVAEVFSSNAFEDVPVDVRDRRVRELGDTVGPIRPQPQLIERVTASSDAAHLKWRIDGERGALVCEIRLIGLASPLVQSLTITRGRGAQPGTAVSGTDIFISATTLEGE